MVILSLTKETEAELDTSVDMFVHKVQENFGRLVANERNVNVQLPQLPEKLFYESKSKRPKNGLMNVLISANQG